MPVFVMSGLLSVTLAFVFYTWGIWGAKRGGEIKTKHVVFLWLGLILDAGGTGLMAMQIGFYRMDIHGIIGTARDPADAGQRHLGDRRQEQETQRPRRPT